MPERRRRAGWLGPYQANCDFSHTPEPAGAAPSVPAGQQRRFVVQRHRAGGHTTTAVRDRRRAGELGGAEGPGLDPAVRRLAVHAEDHPIEYLDFEGVIPSGDYGGGDVIVWDAGTWEPHGSDDPAASVAAAWVGG